MFFVLAIIIPFGSMFYAILDFIRPGVFDVDLKIDENLSNYFEALEDVDKNWIRVEEENLRKNYVS